MSVSAERVLVTGGVRSGKSRYAEGLFDRDRPVRYLTPGYPADPVSDPEWAARVAAHQARRPAAWSTVETLDLAGCLTTADAPVLVDCLGVWVTRTFDTWRAWEQPRKQWQTRFDAEVERLVEAVATCTQPLVLVTNEVGWGVVPAYPAGRLFADSLGLLNQQVADVVDRVILMVAGRPLELPPHATGTGFRGLAG